MALSSYGVLTAAAIARRREGASDSPHYQIHAVDSAGTHLRIAVNVLSQQAPSELLYLAVDDFRHPITDLLGDLEGWSPQPSRPGTASLDFIRGNLFARADMRALPPDVAGPDNDLADLLDHYIQRAIADSDARLFAFGQRWGPEGGVPDKIFGFRPGNGVHDIHMNQGNSSSFQRDDGVWQDGGLLLHFPSESRWVGLFLAFQSQAWHTDDTTGHTITGEGGVVTADSRVRIVAALVNPVGPGPERETVTLLNASPTPVDLHGWRLADRMKRSCAAPGKVLEPGATLAAPLSTDVQLGNKGGALTLLDPAGLKVDGIAYTADDAREEGWTVVF